MSMPPLPEPGITYMAGPDAPQYGYTAEQIREDRRAVVEACIAALNAAKTRYLRQNHIAPHSALTDAIRALLED